MQKRSGKLLILVLLAISIVSLAAWVTSSAVGRARRISRDNRSGGVVSTGGGRGGGIGRGPRFFASQAVKAGPCFVSFRFIRADDTVPLMMGPDRKIVQRFGPFYLGLQLTQIGPGSADFRMIDDSLKITDDTGAVIRHRHNDGDTVWPFTGAVICQSWIESPAPHAVLLKSIEGEVSVLGPGGARAAYPFRIENVPLPGVGRFFGRMMPVQLASIDNVTTPAFELLTDDSASRALNRAEPIHTAAPGQQYLLFGEGIPTSVTLDLGERSDVVTMTLAKGECGSITASAAGHGKTVSVRTWDAERILLTLPTAGGARDGAILQLSRDMFQPLEANIRSPFPAEAGSLAGSISTSFLVGEKPFGRGEVALRVWRLGQGAAEERSVFPLLDQQGRFVLPNMMAGRYRLLYEMDKLRPYSYQGDPPYTTDDYLSTRFGATAGSWGAPFERIVEVHPGQITEVNPIVWRPLKR